MLLNNLSLVMNDIQMSKTGIIHFEKLLFHLSQLVNFHKSMAQLPKELKKRQKLGYVDILQVRASNSIGTYLNCSNIDRKRSSGDLLLLRIKSVTNWLIGKLEFSLKQIKLFLSN